jgi:hypothetical protein
MTQLWATDRCDSSHNGIQSLKAAALSVNLDQPEVTVTA